MTRDRCISSRVKKTETVAYFPSKKLVIAMWPKQIGQFQNPVLTE